MKRSSSAKRKTRHRTPSGRLSRADERPPPPPVLVKRLRDEALAGMRDARWGTELGRLFLADKIEPMMFEAGERWGERVRRYHVAIDSPAASPRALAFERARVGSPPDPMSSEGRKQVARDEAALKAMREAHMVLCSAGPAVERTVRACCEHNQAVGFYEIMMLRRGLLLLANFWRLVPSKQSNRRA
jgi:hypothetical protein